jgi:hypothetical protein
MDRQVEWRASARRKSRAVPLRRASEDHSALVRSVTDGSGTPCDNIVATEDSMTDPTITEDIFLANSAEDLELAIELLDSHGIAFVTHGAFGVGNLREGLTFSVLHRQAAFCREVLAEHGLARGVLPGVEAGVLARQ